MPFSLLLLYLALAYPALPDQEIWLNECVCMAKKKSNYQARYRVGRYEGNRLFSVCLDNDGREYNSDEIEFMFACYRELRRLRVFGLTPKQILRVAKSLGYRIPQDRMA